MIILPIYNIKFSFGVGRNPYKISKQDFEEVYIRKGMTAISINKDFGGNIQTVVGMPSNSIEIFKKSIPALETILESSKPSKIKWFIEKRNLEYAKDLASKHTDIEIEFIVRNNDKFNLFVYSFDKVSTEQFKEIDKMLSRKFSSKIYSCNYESNNSIKEYAYSRDYEYSCLSIQEFIEKGSTDRGVLFFGPEDNYIELLKLCLKHNIPYRFCK